jgi:hypothetical protein
MREDRWTGRTFMQNRAILLLATLLAAACGAFHGGRINDSFHPASEAPRACVAVWVHNGVAGGPVAGAKVEIRGSSGTTNDDGYLYLGDVIINTPGETSPIHVTANGYEPKDTPYTVGSWSCDVHVLLTPIAPPDALRGRARAPADRQDGDGQPLTAELRLLFRTVQERRASTAGRFPVAPQRGLELQPDPASQLNVALQ